MTQQHLTPEGLRNVLSQTLSSNADERRIAEQTLGVAQKIPGHPLEVLRLIASSDVADIAIRQSAAIHFKNIVKKGWNAEAEDGTDGIIISNDDRCVIKNYLVELMCTVPPQIQAQCSESISLIAAVDFPANWGNLLPELVQKFNSPECAVVNGVLLTANSILKRFRFVQRSDTLYKDILYVLERLQAPLLTLFQSTSQAVKAYSNNILQLKPRFSALRYMCRIFFSLTWQDLPEYFEDHMSEWMEEFSKFLNYENMLLIDEGEEIESSPIDTLQAAIVQNLHLFINKDEEPFLPFLPNFTTFVWNLLLRVSSFPKHDVLATTCITFLSLLVGKQIHKHLFQDLGTLKEIIAKIVIPNLMIREVDEERFEEDPQEFIVSDMESGDTDSRRKCSQDLLRAMCRQFESETTSICSEHVDSMLTDFKCAPSSKWASKDAAIHLVLGISIRSESVANGVSMVNDKVDIMGFFTTNILTELRDTNQSYSPMLKSSVIKFVSTFRNQFSKDDMAALMPLLISYLSSPSVVVHTYAAAAIDKFLITKETTENGSKRIKFGGEAIKPFLEPLLTGLFGIVDNTTLNENEYIMKCIMRSLNAGRNDIIRIVHIILEKLTSALFVVAKNPRNPQYNHYLFESIAVVVKSVCSEHPEHTSAFEGLLFPPFQTVLQMDVFEFTPYVFQILSQLLEYRYDKSGLGDGYSMLFKPLLTPVLWERKGNIPALSRLLQAYLRKGASEIVANGHFLGILGVFQKLVASRANEVHAFELLGSVLQFVPEEGIQPHLKNLFQILLIRLQQGKTQRYVRLVTSAFAQYVGMYNTQSYFNLLNSIQNGLGLMFLTSTWIPRLSIDPPIRNEVTIQIICMTKFLCETPSLLDDMNVQKIWSQLLVTMIKIITSSSDDFNASKNDDEDGEVQIGYDPTFYRLHFASRPDLNPFPEVGDPQIILAQGIHSLYLSQPGKISPLIHQTLQTDHKLSAGLETIFQRAGLKFL